MIHRFILKAEYEINSEKEDEKLIKPEKEIGVFNQKYDAHVTELNTYVTIKNKEYKVVRINQLYDDYKDEIILYVEEE